MSAGVETVQAEAAPSPIPYTAEEVGKNFAGLLETFDFTYELRALGIGFWNFAKRRHAKKRFVAMCVALWRIALEHSFPNDADVFFNHFLTTYPPIAADKRSAKKLHALVMEYDALVSEKKDADFTKVAASMTEAFPLSPEEHRKQLLKLSLRIRSIYELIFEKLI